MNQIIEPEDCLVEKRLAVLQLAEALGSVTEACRRAGMTRTQYYDYQRRYKVHGRPGLKNRPPIAKSHPLTTPQSVVNRIVDLSLSCPDASCRKLEALLRDQEIQVSSVTIHKHLLKRGLGTRQNRRLALERHLAATGHSPNALQTHFLERHNPCYRWRHAAAEQPAQLLSQSTLFVGHLKTIGRIYLHAVIDTFSNYAFALVHSSKRPEAAVALLHDQVLPFYEQNRLTVGEVLTCNGREFCGGPTHPFELYLTLNSIQHRRSEIGSPTDGFSESFHEIVRNEFFDDALREEDLTLSALQTALDAWLQHYNNRRPHPGYPNHGNPPDRIIRALLSKTRV